MSEVNGRQKDTSGFPYTLPSPFCSIKILVQAPLRGGYRARGAGQQLLFRFGTEQPQF